jgi:hypothetical protein
MTEKQWLSGDDPQALLSFLGEKATNRKLRLFGCACCRRAWGFIEDPRLCGAIEILERFADKKAKDKDRVSTARVMFEIANTSPNQRHAYLGWELYGLSQRNVQRNANLVGYHVAGAFASPAQRKLLSKAKRKEQQQQAILLRHIIGNPFRSYPALGSWSATVVQLADSLYAGTDCAFALHDALLEAGHTELAEHFREGTHPKGCWALDLILGRT